MSTDAVTTGPRATVLAARPAQMSIQLSTCSTSSQNIELSPTAQIAHECLLRLASCILPAEAFPLHPDRRR